MESAGERVNLEFNMPSRGIIGLRTNVLTASAGEAIMRTALRNTNYKGEIERRTNGSIIAMESGTAFAYAIDKLQDRGKFFIFPQEEVYAGQVVGEHSHDNDLDGERYQIKEADQHACFRFRRESASDSAGTVLSGGSVGIYQGRRVCRGYSQVHAYA